MYIYMYIHTEATDETDTTQVTAQDELDNGDFLEEDRPLRRRAIAAHGLLVSDASETRPIFLLRLSLLRCVDSSALRRCIS